MKRRIKHRRYMIYSRVILVSILLIMFKPSYAEASGTAWDAALTSIDQLYDSLTILESSNKLVKQQTQELRKQNNDKLKVINSQIQLIDKNKIDKLKTEVEQAKKKHDPLLTEYTNLGKKATEARKNNNKKAALMFDLRRNKIKDSATKARQEIKVKTDALTAAKKQASVKAKNVKDRLIPVQTIKKQITAENKQITEWNKSRIAANKRYQVAVKQGDAVIAAAELNLITSELGRIQVSQKKIYSWEVEIRNVIRDAEAKLPK
ncbi:hypothetical protein [Paenibacillus sp. GCM10028914]|uniref:hypothetical protein n=1 Tax=Paenibacillus sp. GCM10028914 TaxID=3273416 RepID=UPI00360C0C18